MEILSELHRKIKNSAMSDASKKMVCGDVPRVAIYSFFLEALDSLRVKSRSLVMFAGMLRFRMLPEVYSYLARLDVEIAL